MSGERMPLQGPAQGVGLIWLVHGNAGGETFGRGRGRSALCCCATSLSCVSVGSLPRARVVGWAHSMFCVRSTESEHVLYGVTESEHVLYGVPTCNT